MIVADFRFLDEYCEWVFGILEDLRRMLPLQGHAREKRILGYLAEGLLSYYAYKRNWKVKEIPLVSMIGDNEILNNQSFQSVICNNLKFHLKKPFRNVVEQDRMVSLSNDGIISAIEKMHE